MFTAYIFINMPLHHQEIQHPPSDIADGGVLPGSGGGPELAAGGGRAASSRAPALPPPLHTAPPLLCPRSTDPHAEGGGQ